MRILFLCSSSELGGAEICLLRLMKLLAEDEQDLSLLVPIDGPLSRQAKKYGIPSYTVPRIGLRELISPIGFSRYVKSIKLLLQVVKRVSPDIVHAFSVRTYEFGLFAQIFARIPIVASIHDPFTKGHFGRRYYLYRFILNYFIAKLICVSKAIEDFAVVAGVRNEKLLTIHNGISCDEYREGMKLICGKKDQFRVAAIGRVAENKGFHVLINSACYLKKRVPKLKIIIVGGIQKDHQLTYLRYVEKMVSQHDLMDVVQFTGWTKNVHDILYSVDMLVTPSLFPDPFPTVNLEAMCMGKPVIATNIGGSREQIIDGETGFIIPPNDPELLSEKILFLYDHPKTRIQMGKNALKRVQKSFTMERCAAEHLRAYEELTVR